MRFWNAVVAVCFSAVLFASTASAATYYVSTSGNDANPGTLASPFKTINKGAGVALPGDSVQVRAGIYNAQVSIGAKGTAAGRITIRNYPGETAVIDGTGLGSSTDLVVFSKATYVDFQGFEVRNAPHIGICIWGAQGIRVLNCDVHNSQRNGIYAGYSALNVNTDLTVSGNDVHDNVLENASGQMSGGGWASGISITETNGATITNNRSYRNHGEGIQTGLTNNALIENNTAYDNFSVNIYLDSSRFITVNRNLVYNSGNTAFYRYAEPAVNISVANETWSLGSNPAANLTITNNIAVNGRWGFYYGNYEAGGGMTNCVIANNTFYKGWEALIKIDNDTHSGTVVENNIFDQVGGVMSSVTTNGVSYRNNLWYGGNAGAAAGAGDVLANPMLANAGGTTAADYKLQSNSPALSAGIIASVVTSDYFGVARFGSFDIGAHQLGSGSAVSPVPTLDTTAPSAPSALVASSQSQTSIALSWNASTDNVGVTGYNIYRNGTLVTATTVGSYVDNGLSAGTTYSYSVKAYDAAGNVSTASNTANATTTGAPVPTADTQAPTAPSNLAAVSAGTSAISLTWNGSTDNVGVTGYRIARNGVDITTVSGTSYVDNGRSASTTYSYTVRAIDAAGNVSASSNSASATTAATTPAADTQAPTVPGSLRVGSVTTSAITLAWNAATDNTAVAGYRLYRNGVFAGSVTTTTWTDANLAIGTYTYTVAAYDAAGNTSAQSAAVSATIAAPKHRAARH